MVVRILLIAIIFLVCHKQNRFVISGEKWFMETIKFHTLSIGMKESPYI